MTEYSIELAYANHPLKTPVLPCLKVSLEGMETVSSVCNQVLIMMSCHDVLSNKQGSC